MSAATLDNRVPASAIKTANAEQAEWQPSFSPWLIAASVMLATFMEVLDTSVANVSLPHIAGNLSATTDEATWVLTSYLVSNAIILPATGWLGSYFGRKRLLIACIVIFTAASGLCGAATSLWMLIVARIIQGAGGGVLQPIAQAVLLESFPPEKRGAAMAVYGMGVVVAPIIGPTLGGWITDNYSWRWIFYINLPVGILAVFMAQTFIEDPPYLRRARQAAIDYIGFALLTIWLAALQIVLDKGQEEDWFSSPYISWLSIIAAAAFVAFILQELRVKEPIVDLHILLNRNFATGVIMIAIVGAVLYGTNAMLPLFLQNLLNYSPLESGLAVSPRGVGSMAAMIVVGRLVGRLDARYLIVFGFSTLAMACFMLGHINLQIASSSVTLPSIISGFALGFIFVPLTTISMGTLERAQISNATGIYNLMRNIGGGFGISIVTTLLARGAQQNQAVLSGNFSPYNPAFQQRAQEIQQALAAQNGGHTSLQQVYGIMYQMLLGQSNALAFIHNFRLFGYVCLACIPLAFVFKRVKARPGAQAAAH
jgi:DHA2 family multidrug resistance protein